MSESDRTKQRLTKQRNDLELLNQVMRHDIRNDLQLVEAYAELLDDHVDADGEAYLSVIKESARNAVALTTSARDLAEVMLRDDLEPAGVMIDHVVSQQVEEVRAAYPTAVITVEEAIPERKVVGDDLLGSVFRNLLRNAIQHNDKTPPKVWVAGNASDDTVEIRVADNGPGIPDAARDDIFGKGEKGLDSPGAGIGLYLVQSLVDSYDGSVWIEDNDPEGTVFVVQLPICEENEPA